MTNLVDEPEYLAPHEARQNLITKAKRQNEKSYLSCLLGSPVYIPEMNLFKFLALDTESV